MFLYDLFKNPEKANILTLNLKVLQKFGVLTQNSNDKKLCTRIVEKFVESFLLIMMVYCFGAVFVELYITSSDFESIAMCATFVLTYTKNLARHGSLTVHRKNFLKLIFSIQENRFIKAIKHTNNEYSLVKSYANLAIKIARYVWIVFLFTAISLICNLQKPNVELSLNSTVAEARRVSVFKIWLPFKGTESPYFELITFFEYTLLISYFFFVTVINTTIVALIISVAGQFSLLAECILTTNDHFKKDDTTKELGKHVASLDYY